MPFAEGRLEWDAPLTRYLPQLRFSDPYLQTHLTLRDALAHRTGLEGGDLAWRFNPGIPRSQTLTHIQYLQAEAPFRSTYLYNNYMYLAAGEVIPAVTGTSWNDFVRSRLIEPLGMRRTTTSVSELAAMSNIAMPHALLNGRLKAIAYYNVDHLAPAGAINSSAADMARWCQVQLGGGSIDGRQVIPRAVIEETRRAQIVRPLSNGRFMGTLHLASGFGLNRMNFGSQEVVYVHGGNIDGMMSYLAFAPSANVCTVVLTNSAPNAGLHSEIVTWVLARLLHVDNADAAERFRIRARASGGGGRRCAASQRVAQSIAAASMALNAYAGSYANDLYGDLNIRVRNGELWLTLGRLAPARLRHHGGDAFDYEHGQDVLGQAPMVLTFQAGANGVVQTVQLQHFGDEATVATYTRKPS